MGCHTKALSYSFSFPCLLFNLDLSRSDRLLECIFPNNTVIRSCCLLILIQVRSQVFNSREIILLAVLLTGERHSFNRLVANTLGNRLYLD